MRIGMDITPATARPTGVGEYVLRTLLSLLPLLTGNDRLVGWATGLHKPAGLPPDFTVRHLPAPTRAAYMAWRLSSRPRVDALMGGLDLFHATNFFLPPTATARRVLSIYDLAFLIEPRWASPKIVKPFSRDVPRFALAADAVITCSEHSRRDIVRLCGVAPERVHVVYGAPDPLFHPRYRDEACARTKKLFGWDDPFVLYVGTLESRKNIETLLRAFSTIARECPHRLVLVGGMGWNMAHLPELIVRLGLTDRVHLPGYLPSRKDLALVYGAADLFVLPSHYEGFGLPLIEAIASGCPAIASSSSSLPEVGGDAVRYFNPDDDHELALAMHEVLSNSALRAGMVQKGLEQAKRFTWDETAHRTLSVYRSLA